MKKSCLKANRPHARSCVNCSGERLRKATYVSLKDEFVSFYFRNHNKNEYMKTQGEQICWRYEIYFFPDGG